MRAHSYTPAELEAAARTLGGAARAGESWTCRCPAHDDGTASLSLSLGEGGRLLWHCHAGCHQAAVLDGLRAAGVLLNGDARPAEPRPKARSRGRIVARYPYVDEAGVLRFEVVRFDPKDFRQRRPDGKGGWIWSLGDTGRVLFRLSEVLAAEDTVFVVEGEKDALNLAAVGLCGTTSPQGAKFWRDDLAAPLAGKRVAVLPDNDPVGREHAHRVAAAACRHGATSVKVVELEGLAEHGDISDWLAFGRTADELRALIAAAPEWRPAEAEPTKAPPAASEGREDGRVEIRLSDERRNVVMAECAGLLQEVVYLRDTVPTMLARAAEVGGKQVEDKHGATVDLDGVRHRPGAPLFIEALPARVAYQLDERALFRRHLRREDEWVATHCPKDLAASIVDAAVFLDLRACAGIVHVPLLVGGELVTDPGYHAPTGLILDLRGLRLDVPTAPDKDAAQAALARLLRPFRGYLDKKVVDRSALAAAALTAVLRPSLPTCPGIAIDGNNPGVGKGKLARILGALNAGGIPAIVTEGHSPEETEKRLATAVIQGAPAILLDNLQRPLASSTLESMLTEPRADIRIFGRLGNLRVMCRSLVLLTANNATLRRDMLRRTLPLRVVVPDEKPELRRFDFDPVAEALADRTELLAAAFTVALAWRRVRDLPENRNFRKPLGSFEEWADLVGGAVAWLTGTNPVDLIEERGEQDPGAADERGIIDALAAKYGVATKKYEARWAAKEAARDIPGELWATVVKLKGEQPDAGTVGRWLRSRKDRVFGDLILTNEVDRNGVAKWSVRGMRGMAGDAPTPRARFGEDEEGVDGSTSREAGGNIPRHPPHPPHPAPEEPGWIELRDDPL